MFKRYADTVDAPWVDMTVHPESIPHPLHWDFAYLWVLEKRPELRPKKDWASRIEAWRFLLGLLLTGRLRIREEPLQGVLLAHLGQFGIVRVSWALLDNVVVGVLSPTVGIRPLPDYKAPDLDKWRQSAGETEDRKGVAHYAQLWVAQLGKGEDRSFRKRLSEILVENCAPGLMPLPLIGPPLQLPVLREMRWTADAPGNATIDYESLPIGGTGRVPGETFTCDQCGASLLRSPSDSAIVVVGQTLSVPCVSCHASANVNLDRLLVWVVNDDRAVLWQFSNQMRIQLPKHAPPIFKRQGRVLEYEWPSAMFPQNGERRYLKLDFGLRQLEEQDISSVFYPKLLLPARPRQLPGLPLRFDWRGALRQDAKVTNGEQGGGIIVRGLFLNGWPDEISLPYTGDSLLSHEENLSLGVFPDATRMPEGWQWYRAFVNGPARSRYRLRSDPDGVVVLPWVSDLPSFPSAIAVESSDDKAGVLYQPPSTTRVPAAWNAQAYVGIDFGTSNTVIYQQGGSNPPVPSESDAVHPGELYKLAQWFCGDAGQDAVLADFLRGPGHKGSPAGRYLVPSAIWWLDNGRSVIRWSSTPPAQAGQAGAVAGRAAQAYTNLKFDHIRERAAYLKEVTLLSLAVVACKLSPGATVALAFAFPLVMDYTQRMKFAEDLVTVKKEAERLTGLTCSLSTIDESSACVLAFGSHNAGDTFLVADLGGGTLDVSLFAYRTTSETDIEQIGSVAFAGEDCLNAVVKVRGTHDDPQLWAIRDAIAEDEGKAASYGRDKGNVVLQRFLVFVLEFLRTMLLAKVHSDEATERTQEPLALVLVGNGWHLVDAFSAESARVGRRKVFTDRYGALVEALGVGRAQLKQSEILGRLPSTKHLVAVGALMHAVRGGADYLARDADLPQSRLPGGRGMTFNVRPTTLACNWHMLVGEGVPLFKVSHGDVENATLTFNHNDRPPTGPDWQQLLDEAFGGTEPGIEDDRLRSFIRRSIAGTPKARLAKGPLQVLLEEFWKDRLAHP